MDWCSVYLTPQGLPKYIYLSPPLIFPTTYNGIRTKNHPVWITLGAAPIRWMGPIRNPRWEQKQTEGYVIVSNADTEILSARLLIILSMARWISTRLPNTILLTFVKNYKILSYHFLFKKKYWWCVHILLKAVIFCTILIRKTIIKCILIVE
jgi:hypothetical protein